MLSFIYKVASKCPSLEGLLSHWGEWWWALNPGSCTYWETALPWSHISSDLLLFTFLFSDKISLHHLSRPWTCSVAPASLDFTILLLWSPDQLDLQDILLALPDYMFSLETWKRKFSGPSTETTCHPLYRGILMLWSVDSAVTLACHIPCSDAAGLHLSYVLLLFCFSYLLVCTWHHHKLT